jgi:hypothetical protein
VLLAVSYLVPTATRMANPFFGTNVDVLLLLGAVLLLAGLFSHAEADVRRHWPVTVGWIAVAVSLVTFHWPPAHYNKGGEWAQRVNRLSDQLYQTIRDYPGSHNSRVFFTAPGPVDDMLFRYRAAVDGLKFWCPNRHLSSNLDVFRNEIESADFVVASDPENALVYEKMIAPNIEAAALQMARQNPQLNELVSLPGLGGKFFHVFVRRDLSPGVARKVPFEDPWRPLYGLD